MSRFTFCNCPAGFNAEPERHAPDCPGRSGAGKPAMRKPDAAVKVRPEGCCCPPAGYSGLWAAGPCPVHQGLRRLAQPAEQHQGEPVACQVEFIQGEAPRVISWNDHPAGVYRLYTHADPAEHNNVVSFGIQIEKLLCGALGREWSATGISIETLVAELKSKADPGEVERLRNELGEAKGEYDRSANKVAALRAQLAERDALPPFAQTIIRKLKRFRDCAEDSQGADIGKIWFDVLVQLGLLNLVQRSPAWWEITDEGEALLDGRAALSASAERNQCDGCQAGIPLVNGTHRMGKPGGYADAMSCQSAKYASAEPSAPVERDELVSMIDAAMVEMAHIHPPLKRQECERLIRAALGRQP